MPSAEFVDSVTSVADWITCYLRDVEGYPVLPDVEPGDLRRALPPRPPAVGEPMEEILADFSAKVVPALTHWNHPSFFGYFPVTGSGPGILGEMLAAALNVNAMVWRSSPAGTELEEHSVSWLRQMVGLPEAFHGVINDTASSSSLYALAAARETRLPEAAEEGLAGAPRVRVYVSDQAHSSIAKAVQTLGMGRRGVRTIESDDAFRMKVDALRHAIREDLEAGVRPLAVVATLGTTSTTSVDPIAEISSVAKEHDLWLHVDAAYGGAAAIVPELRAAHFDGWDEADSIVVNPHKWLFTPIDCSVLFCRSPEALRAAFSLTPAYLETPDIEATNLMDYGVSLGRRFRALKLWFVLRYFGVEGLVARIRCHCDLAATFSGWIDEASDWTRVAPVPFSTVAFRYTPPDVPPDRWNELNRAIVEHVNASGALFLTDTVLGNRRVLRLSIGNLRTTAEHVARAFDRLRAAAAEVRGG